MSSSLKAKKFSCNIKKILFLQMKNFKLNIAGMGKVFNERASCENSKLLESHKFGLRYKCKYSKQSKFLLNNKNKYNFTRFTIFPRFYLIRYSVDFNFIS